MSEYDFTIVGAGLAGAVYANALTSLGYKCRILEREQYIGGLCLEQHFPLGNDYIQRCQCFGAHIFHTANPRVRDFCLQTARWREYNHQVFAYVCDEYISFPPNKLTYQQLDRIPARSRAAHSRLFIPYTNKMWGEVSEDREERNKFYKEVQDRITWRDDFDSRYFPGEWSAMPVDGYTAWIKSLIGKVPVQNDEFSLVNMQFMPKTERVIYTGCVSDLFPDDEPLPYRSLRFDLRFEPTTIQHCAVLNWPNPLVPYIRSVEHKFLNPPASGMDGPTVVSYEYPLKWTRYDEDKNGHRRMYPIAIDSNRARREDMLDRVPFNTERVKGGAWQIHFAGRLGKYRYMDMDEVVEDALDFCTALGAEPLRHVAWRS